MLFIIIIIIIKVIIIRHKKAPALAGACESLSLAGLDRPENFPRQLVVGKLGALALDLCDPKIAILPLERNLQGRMGLHEALNNLGFRHAQSAAGREEAVSL